MSVVRRLRVNDIGEYIRFHSCQRRIRLSYNNQELARRLPFWGRFYNPIDPVLQLSGELHENEFAEILDGANYTQIHFDEDVAEEDRLGHTLENLRQVHFGDLVYAREVNISGQLGIYEIRGRIDFLLLYWDGLGRPRIRIIETKRSRRDKTYHRIQLAIYYLLLRNYLETNPLTISNIVVNPEDIECNIIKIDETTNEIESFIDIEPIDNFDREESDINHLLMEDGTIDRILSYEPELLDELDYKLDSKCDNCLYNIHCFSESCRRGALELLSIDPSLVRILEEQRITNLTELLELDLDSPEAENISQDPNFPIDLAILQCKGGARISTLPHDANLDPAWPVQALPYSSFGQLPLHRLEGVPLIRVYLAVDYDYIEDRIVGLSAQLTNSEGHLATLSSIEGDQRVYDPDLIERFISGYDDNGDRVYDYQPYVDNSIVRLVTTPWSGSYERDTGIERQLISEFFMDLVDHIRELSQIPLAPIHFYVWSRSEITHLLESCTRAGAGLLANLRQLFGCREPLEQLIFSCVQEEVNNRFALGYTGRGLSVVSKLMWYGQFFHWTRRVGHREVWLEERFEQDLFDFRSRLDITANNQWARRGDAVERVIQVEIRSRFFDSITMPYWHAFWRTLPDPNDVEDALTRRAIQRYNRITEPGVFRAFFPARLQALRWIEEKISKNHDIYKELINVDELPDFTLGIDNTRTAALDFLRLDHHIEILDWMSQILLPPITKVSNGRSIPVTDFLDIDAQVFMATINCDDYHIDLDTIRRNTTLDVGDYVRITSCDEDPRIAQRLGEIINSSWTCRIDNIDWDTGDIIFSKAWRRNPSRYILQSRPIGDSTDRFTHATLDEHVDDWTSKTVDHYLHEVADDDSPAFRWFNPQNPNIPEQERLSEETDRLYRNILSAIQIDEHHLSLNQIDAILEGLNSRIQLLQGPPGTGKTTTTAIALLLRILSRRQRGDIVFINTNTHAALRQVLTDIVELLPSFQEACRIHGATLHDITLCKVHSSEITNPVGGDVIDLVSTSCIQWLNRLRHNSIVILGGTVNALLKMTQYFEASATYTGFRTPMLVVDEASMIVFPHFLALASVIEEEGEIMLAGDHRQLSPITSHDWESEDRPPVQVFQPYFSVFNAIRNLKLNHEGVSDRSVKLSALELSFRLPPALISLLSRLYERDDIQLRGLERETDIVVGVYEVGSILSRLWLGDIGLYLVLHSEQSSHKANPFEVDLVQAILNEAEDLPEGEVAIITPHRAQRNLLQRALREVLTNDDIIDTVEKLQGDERDIVLVSATVSNPSIISSHVDFILNLNRANVAFSRCRDRLIVICSEELVNFIPVEMEDYDAAMLWKALRDHCTMQIGELEFHEENVRILTVPPQD